VKISLLPARCDYTSENGLIRYN